MKIALVTALSLACFVTASLRAADGTVQAAVVTSACSAELQTTNPPRKVGTRSLAEGEVYEVAGRPGFRVEMKIDQNQVAVVPLNSVRIRECSAAELSSARQKFGVLNLDSQKASRAKISEARQAGLCATCPKVQAAAQTNYLAQTKALREQNQALLKEAKEWAAGKASLASSPSSK